MYRPWKATGHQLALVVVGAVGKGFQQDGETNIVRQFAVLFVFDRHREHQRQILLIASNRGHNGFQGAHVPHHVVVQGTVGFYVRQCQALGPT